ncbi:uncharacterized protein LAESUDRAFT_551901 [Laetiporus sulphureus 93-53]|uniref:Uncharacterized protein n=1 Tax=Laetiporus sulphureus 93-53 TaxID=1314785 RepID=A0A165FTE7_9APHY|nr:uncharacterized protein LAESUDRAFT_551901 [Laetiporus sulphureus 93-53]KZT09386.1 hypothetical protein LAESUDRAFT_551901 [Laetiporus sulphureus 93-53]
MLLRSNSFGTTILCRSSIPGLCASPMLGPCELDPLFQIFHGDACSILMCTLLRLRATNLFYCFFHLQFMACNFLGQSSSSRAKNSGK